MTAERPLLSICVATTAGWPAIEPCLRAFVDDARQAGAEVLVTDGSGRPPPTDPTVTSVVTWIQIPGDSVFQLVQANLARATGEIVAITEDHCTPRPGWVPAILRAHAEYPAAAAIGGAVENGDPSGGLRWASHMMTQGAHMAPLQNGPVGRITGEANVSFKSQVLTDIGDHPLGFLTLSFLQSLAARNELIVNDDRIVVDHHETLDPRATAVIHFDDGRTIAGFRRTSMERGDWLRLLASPVLPLYRAARVVRMAIVRGHGRTVMRAVPWLLVLEYAHEAGEVAGYVLGPGRSPYGLR
jgi:glycosyl transferase family 2